MCSKEKYWETDSDLRLNLHSESLIFDVNYPVKQKISKDSPLWNDWVNDDYLIILVELPKSYIDIPWKMIIPLESSFWGSSDIFIYISDKGLIRLDKELDYPDPTFISDEDMKRITI